MTAILDARSRSRMCLHVHAMEGRPGAGLSRADTVKLIHTAPWRALKQFQGTEALSVAKDAGVPVRILRVYRTEEMTPNDAAGEIMKYDLSAVTHVQAICENDTIAFDQNWQMVFYTVLHQRGYTGTVIFMGASTGWPRDYDSTTHPPDPHFPDFMKILGLFQPPVGGNIGYDGYPGVTVHDPLWAPNLYWTAERTELMKACWKHHGIPVPQLFYLESGPVDNTIAGTAQGGWQKRRIDPIEAFATLVALDDIDMLHDEVVCRAHFTLNGTQDWVDTGYEMAPLVWLMAERVNKFAQVRPSPLPVPAPPAPSLKPTGWTAQQRSIRVMPIAPLFHFDQGNTKDCWVRCIEALFDRYGIHYDVDAIFQAGKHKAYPAGGEAATFAELKQAVTSLAQQAGVKYQEIDLDNPEQVWQALRDPDRANPWTVIAGVKESDLQPGQNYGHYLLINDNNPDDGMIEVIDSYANENGDVTGSYPIAEFAQAMKDNWDTNIDALGYKLLGIVS